MNTMNIPGFTADQSLHAARGHFRSPRPSASLSGAVIPAIPPCGACEAILDRCEENGWRPRAACSACARGHCYDPPPRPDPFLDPFPWRI